LILPPPSAPPRPDGTEFPKPDMTINVITLTGKRIKIECASDNYIEEIKWIIFEKEEIAPDQQRLICAGKQLEDGK
jgi:ubiquitin C